MATGQDDLEHQVTLGGSVVEGGDDAFLVDDAHAFGRDFQGDPHILLGDVELLGLQVGAEGAFGMDARVRHIVAHDYFLSGDFTFLRHCSILFIVVLRYFCIASFQRKRRYFFGENGCKSTTFFGHGKMFPR